MNPKGTSYAGNANTGTVNTTKTILDTREHAQNVVLKYEV